MNHRSEDEKTREWTYPIVQRTDAESAILTAEPRVAEVWRWQVVLVGDAAENPAALDSRQAAAKRADRDRRAVHAPRRSPSEMARFLALHCQCAADVAGKQIRDGRQASCRCASGPARVRRSGTVAT